MSDGLILLENILQLLLTSVLIGSVYGLLCVGLGMIFSVMRVINFAQGEFMMLGMYAAFFFFQLTGINAVFGPWAGLVVSALVAGGILYLIGAILHPALLARVTGARVAGTEGDGHYPQLILTLGLSLVLANGGLILFGSSPHSIQTPLSSSAWVLGPFAGGDLMLFLNKARTLTFLATVVIAVLVALFISRTRTGKVLRAAADNAEAATYMGIDVTKAHRFAFALGAAITGAAGGLLASSYPFQPYVGHEFVVIMYAGVVLGGMGSIKGAFWGGLCIGFIQQMSSLVLPLQLQNAAIFVMFLLVMLLRPQGLFGRNTDRA